MTESEIKARALVLSFLPHSKDYESAKLCAVITVNEILADELGIMPAKWMADYWIEIKSEIETL